jgi:hypothetical protein
MRAGYGRAVIAVAAMVTLAACGGKGDPQLMNLRTGQGPDEFAIVPPKALEMPESLADLPEPTPGGFNRTDQTPEADAAVALGGKPSAERLFNLNVYYRAYSKQRLDQQAELARWRALGVRTPSAPPRQQGEE